MSNTNISNLTLLNVMPLWNSITDTPAPQVSFVRLGHQFTNPKSIMQSMMHAAEHRAEEADLHDQRCLIENVVIEASEKKAGKTGHVFEREVGASESRVAPLEWSWNMKRKTLNLDTRRNVFFLGVRILQLYIEHRWGLLPEERIIDVYFDPCGQNVLGRSEFPVLPAQAYNYSLIPLQGMDNDNVVVHQYPFNTFPLITSHIDPKFAIAHVGSVLSGITRAVADFEHDSPISRLRMTPQTREALIAAYPILAKVWKLYQAWMGAMPEGWRDEESFAIAGVKEVGNKECDASDDEESVCTPQRRIRTWMKGGGDDELERQGEVEDEVKKEEKERSTDEVLEEFVAGGAAAHAPEPTTPPRRVLRSRKVPVMLYTPAVKDVAAPLAPSALTGMGIAQIAPPTLASSASVAFASVAAPDRRITRSVSGINPRKRRRDDELVPETAAPKARRATAHARGDQVASAANSTKRRRVTVLEPDNAALVSAVKLTIKLQAPAKRRRERGATSKAVVTIAQVQPRAEAESAAPKRRQGRPAKAKVVVQPEVVAPLVIKLRRAITKRLTENRATKSASQPEEAEGGERIPGRDITNRVGEGETSTALAALAAEEPFVKGGRILRKKT